ncbi:hypothetical protein ADUPG1_005432, partial [Aduncisulcus paluster]
VKRIESLRPELEKIADFLQQHDMEAKARFNSLKSSLADAAPAKTVELARLIDKFDFGKAHQILEQLFEQCDPKE